MKRLALAMEEIDASTSTTRKVQAIAAYLREASAEDAAWGVYFLTGRKLSRVVTSRQLAEWVCDEARIPAWLFSECYSAVGDLAETVHLLMPKGEEDDADAALHAWVQRVQEIRHESEPAQREALLAWLRRLQGTQRLLLIKMLTGALRIGVSQTLVERAAAEVAGVEPAVIAHRLSGAWLPSAGFARGLLAARHEREAGLDQMRPYPFFLASPLEGEPGNLGAIDAWQLEWKWDGIRGQLIKRGGTVLLWSRGDELLTERFPEIVDAARGLDDVVLDGEILAWHEAVPLGFAALQRRIGRKSLSRKILSQVPVSFVAYDVLEHEGRDLRGEPLRARRARLEEILNGPRARSRHMILSEVLRVATWQDAAAKRQIARERGVEGVMIKALTSAYAAGRVKGDWWKWKIEPFTVDAVLIGAEPGHGRRAGILTDYTFAVWDDGQGERTLVPCTRAYSGLNQEEIAALDRWIRAHTVERKGPVRLVEPLHVFELHFEGIAESPRHKSGIALRFPRISRWRVDKPVGEADTLATLRALLKVVRERYSQGGVTPPESGDQLGLWDSPRS